MKTFLNDFEYGRLPTLDINKCNPVSHTHDTSALSSPTTATRKPASYQRAVMECTISGLLNDMDFQAERIEYYRSENKKLKQDKVNLEVELEKLSRLYGLVSAEKPDSEAAWQIIQKELFEVKGDYTDLFERYTRKKLQYEKLKEKFDQLA